MEGFRTLRRRAVRAYISAVAIAALATNVGAVTLSNVEGVVSVNCGDGFQSASIGTTLSAGDRVRVGASGSANIVYENGCAARVGPSQVVAVLATPPVCQGASMKDGPAFAPVFAPDPLLAGALVVGAGVGLAVALSNNNNNNNSVSP